MQETESTKSRLGRNKYFAASLGDINEGTHIFPAQRCFTALAKNIRYRMQSCQQNTLFSWATANVDSENRPEITLGPTKDTNTRL